MREARNALWALLATAASSTAALAQDGVAGPAVASILAIYAIPPALGWALALLTLRGGATIFGTLLGLVGCLIAAGGMMVFLILLDQGTAWSLLAACVLPSLCLVGHVARLRRARRSKGSVEPRPRRGFFRDLWRHL
jgi:hypothetical protein